MNSENAHPGIHVYCLLKWGPFNEILYEKVLQISMVVKKAHFTFFWRGYCSEWEHYDPEALGSLSKIVSLTKVHSQKKGWGRESSGN